MLWRSQHSTKYNGLNHSSDAANGSDAAIAGTAHDETFSG